MVHEKIAGEQTLQEGDFVEHEITAEILQHYLEYSSFTNPGPYEDYLKEELPDDVEDIGYLVRKQLIHRATLRNGNTGSNTDMKYGDITKVPWYRQPEDDIFPTAPAMLAELFRRDKRGFVEDRNEESKLVLTCRFVSILTTAILKAKGVPARVRSGFAPYFEVEGMPGGKSDDHWINQYWNKEESRWITIDVDGSLEELKFNPYDIPPGTFDFAADAWLNVRNGKVGGDHFYNASGYTGLITVAWELFYDFHCLMNDEVVYFHTPEMVHSGKFEKLTEEQLQEIDELAQLIQKPDENYSQLKHIWETKKEFRLLKGGLL